MEHAPVMLKYALASLFFLSQPLMSLEAQKSPLVSVAEQARQAVVFIVTETNPFELAYGKNQLGYYEHLRPFYDYFWPSEHAFGSGFIISPDGYIVTNDHVADEATTVLIVLRSGKTFICPASIVGKDPRTDISVLKIDCPQESPLPFLSFGDSDQLQLGEQIICVGNPVLPQLETTVTAGIISGVDRNNFGLHAIEGYIQTDAAINQGNSGGPVLNSKGEVIGVVSWILSHYLGYEGISFAIPSHIAQTIAYQIIDNGKPSQGFLGVELDADEEMESTFQRLYFDRKKGARISSVIQDSPAEIAGLKSGDVILKVEQQLVQSTKSLRNRIAILEPQTSVQLTVDREGTLLDVILELGSEELSSAHSQLNATIIVI